MTTLQGKKIFLTSKKEKQIIAKYEGMKKGNKKRKKYVQKAKEHMGTPSTNVFFF